MQGWVSGIVLVAAFAAVAVGTGVAMARLYLAGRPVKPAAPAEPAEPAGSAVPAVFAQLAGPDRSDGPAQEAEPAPPGESSDA